MKNKHRIKLLAVPVDAVEINDLEAQLEQLLSDGGQHHIVLLDLWGLIRARGKSSFAKSIQKSSLIIPTSRTIKIAAQFLKLGNVPRYMPFEFVIKTLNYLEKKGRSIYLIGSKPYSLHTAASPAI